MEVTHPLLTGFPVVIALDVGWSDMDAYDHVSNLVYFRYFQDARVAYLSRVGWMDLKRERGTGPIVKSAAATYRKPVTYPDRVWVGARAAEVQSDRVLFEHTLVSRAWGAVACEGTALLVSYDYAVGAKCPLPEGVRATIARLEAGERPA